MKTEQIEDNNLLTVEGGSVFSPIDGRARLCYTGANFDQKERRRALEP